MVDKSFIFAKQILWKSKSQKKPTGNLITFYLHEKRHERVARAQKIEEEDETTA